MATTLEQKKTASAGRNGKAMPPWDVAHLYPTQGFWTEDDYFQLESTCGNRMIELSNGCIEVLPMPTLKHQRIVKWMLRRVDDFIETRGLGEAAMAPLPVRLFKGQIREPDIMFFQARRILDADARSLDAADLVMEVPSRGKKNRERDLKIKRRVYAQAKIPEYWIIDVQMKIITVLTLSGKSYKAHGEFKAGQMATSKLLKGFRVAVSDVFAAGEGK